MDKATLNRIRQEKAISKKMVKFLLKIEKLLLERIEKFLLKRGTKEKIKTFISVNIRTFINKNILKKDPTPVPEKIKRTILEYITFMRLFLIINRMLLIRIIMDYIFTHAPMFIIRNYSTIKKILNIMRSIFGPLSSRRIRFILRQIARFISFSSRHYMFRLFEKFLTLTEYTIKYD